MTKLQFFRELQLAAIKYEADSIRDSALVCEEVSIHETASISEVASASINMSASICDLVSIVETAPIRVGFGLENDTRS